MGMAWLLPPPCTTANDDSSTVATSTTSRRCDQQSREMMSRRTARGQQDDDDGAIPVALTSSVYAQTCHKHPHLPVLQPHLCKCYDEPRPKPGLLINRQRANM